ncbi:hypothetical protein H2202_003572 [Exophiala xenobiotica]|nr:hypothetical protein H2202_003572 [Exophiala xenobiotica]
MRITRAALRAQAHDETPLIHEDTDADTSRDESGTIHETERPALKDITDENYPTTEDNFAIEEQIPLSRVKSRGEQKQTKKDKTEDESTEGEQQEVLEAATYDSQEQTDEAEGGQDTALVEPEAVQLPACVEAVDAAAEESQPLTYSYTPSPPRNDPPKTPKFDPTLHVAEGVATPTADTVEDSFVDKIKTRSPSKMQFEQQEQLTPVHSVEQTTHVPRIEDSVEAIDALEDAIEEVSERLPDLDGLEIESPIKSRKTTPAPLNLQRTPGTARKAEPVSARSVRKSPRKAPSIGRPPQPRPSVSRASSIKAKPTLVAKQPKKPIFDGLKAREPSASSTLPSLSFSNSPAKSLPNTTKKRVPSATLSTNKPAFVPAKSAKPPTKPTFTLPGEAISAKLKAEREEKLRREEEAEKERKVFKARPAPRKTSRPSVLPRENKASQARVSIYSTGTNKENVAPKSRPSSFHAAVNKDVTKANSSVRRTTSVMERSTAKPRVSSLHLAAGQKLAVTKEDQAQQKARGKAVFGRNKVEMERLEKERKEKEDAARKARAEAAERGRQASREWAEKQKKKMAAGQTAAKSGKDEGRGLVAVNAS